MNPFSAALPVDAFNFDPAAVSIECLTDRSLWPGVDRLLREYVPWVMERLAEEHGMRFADTDAEMEKHHAAFAAEMNRLLAAPGRLLLAHRHGQLAGLVALKPVDAGVAEIKRLYVRSDARGHGVGRALLQRLLADARTEGFHTVRLETMRFMTEANAMYQALGFTEVAPFADSQAEMSNVVGVTRFMALVLQPARQGPLAAELTR